jgi:hypothetical protein
MPSTTQTGSRVGTAIGGLLVAAVVFTAIAMVAVGGSSDPSKPDATSESTRTVVFRVTGAEERPALIDWWIGAVKQPQARSAPWQETRQVALGIPVRMIVGQLPDEDDPQAPMVEYTAAILIGGHVVDEAVVPPTCNLSGFVM